MVSRGKYQKDKCLVFAKGRPSSVSHEWILKGGNIEVCKSYCYLGVTFTNSGSMKTASQILNAKAVNAMFSLIRNTKISAALAKALGAVKL